MPSGVPAVLGRATESLAELEHAPERALRSDANVLVDLDRMTEVTEGRRRLLERDHLHVLAELARLVELLLRQLEEEAAIRYVNGAPSVERLGPLARDIMELEESEPLPMGVQVLLRATPELINAAIAEAKRRDGTIQGYLEHHGLEPDAIQRLREQL